MLSPPPLPLLLYLMCRRVSGVSEGLSTPLLFLSPVSGCVRLLRVSVEDLSFFFSRSKAKGVSFLASSASYLPHPF